MFVWLNANMNSNSHICFVSQCEFQRAGGGASTDLHPVEGGLWSDDSDPSGAPHTHGPPPPQLHSLGGGPHWRTEAAPQGHWHWYHHNFPFFFLFFLLTWVVEDAPNSGISCSAEFGSSVLLMKCLIPRIPRTLSQIPIHTSLCVCCSVS